MSMSGPVGSGIPNNYPLAINSPLDRAYLRPLQEPLYDTEEYVFTANNVTTQLTYFQRPISQNTAAGNIQKDISDTNINQSSMLDYPREFSILGFNVVFDSTIGLRALGNIIRRAAFSFVFSGRRPYLQCPLDRIPAGQGLEGAVAAGSISPSSLNGSAVISCFKNGMGHIANYYKFNLGRSALKIKPGEAFNAKLYWPVAVANTTGVQTLNDFYGQTSASLSTTGQASWLVKTLLVGLSWSPL